MLEEPTKDDIIAVEGLQYPISGDYEIVFIDEPANQYELAIYAQLAELRESYNAAAKPLLKALSEHSSLKVKKYYARRRA